MGEVVTSEGKITTVKKTVDDFGNVISEDVETIIMESGDDFDKFSKRIAEDIPEGMVVVTSESKVTSVKKTVDQYGNVISEDVQTTVLKSDEDIDNISKTPQAFIPTDKETKSTIVTDIIKPSDKIKMTVLRGRNLEKQTFGKPDPYVILSYGEQVEKSKVVKGNLNPQWSLEKILTVTKDSPKEILIEVYDKDKVTKDDFMGRTSIIISDIPKFSQGCWIPLKDCKNGEIFLSGEIIPSTFEIPTVKEAEPKVVKDKKSLPGDTNNSVDAMKEVPADNVVKPSKMEVDDAKKDQLVFTLHSAKNLVNKDKLGKSDPYAVINFGSQTQRTKTINNNLNPTWQHQVIFEVDEKSPSTINIDLFDDDYGKDEPIGKTSLSLEDIKRKGTIVNQPQKLSDCKTGEITFSAKYVDSTKEKESRIPDTRTGMEVVTSEGKITTVKRTVDEF